MTIVLPNVTAWVAPASCPLSALGALRLRERQASPSLADPVPELTKALQLARYQSPQPNFSRLSLHLHCWLVYDEPFFMHGNCQS